MKINETKGKSNTQTIDEVLLSFPVKSLIRFKSVSKSWASYISNPDFAKLHFQLAAAHTWLLFTSEPSVPYILSIGLNQSFNSVYAKLSLPPHNNNCSSLALSTSCRGFIMVEFNDTLYLWNPSIGTNRVVLTPSLDSNFSLFLQGFGYDPSRDDYFVVMIFQDINLLNDIKDYYDPQPDEHLHCVKLLSVKDNMWTEIGNTSLFHEKNHSYYHNEFGLFLNNAIHWLAFNLHESTNVIVAFELTGRTFLEIPAPVDFLHFSSCLLGVLGGLLSLSVTGWNHPTEIWVMKEYKVQSSWIRTFKIHPGDIHSILPVFCFIPICSLENGDIIGTDIIS